MSVTDIKNGEAMGELRAFQKVSEISVRVLTELTKKWGDADIEGGEAYVAAGRMNGAARLLGAISKACGNAPTTIEECVAEALRGL